MTARPEQWEPGSSRRTLRLLIAEDNPADAQLMAATLKRAGYSLSFDIVDSAEEFQQRLEQTNYDIILADHNLRTWTGMDALKILQQSAKDIPFVAITATLGDEAAVEYIKCGAADYLLKDRLERLPSVVGRALSDKAHREEATRLQEHILYAKREWDLTFDSVPDALIVLGETGCVQRVNRAAVEALGFKDFSDLIGKTYYEVIHGLNSAPPPCPIRKFQETGIEQQGDIEIPHLGKTFNISCTPFRDSSGGIRNSIVVLHDITERKRAENEKARLTSILEATTDLVAIAELSGKILYMNRGGRKLLGFGESEDLSDKINIGTHPAWAAQLVLNEGIPTALRNGSWSGETALLSGDGREIPVSQVILSHKSPDGTVQFLSTIARDITERKKAEEALSEREQRLSRAESLAIMGHYAFDADGGNFIASDGLKTIWGFEQDSTASFAEYVPRLHPDDHDWVMAKVAEAVREMRGFDIGYRIIRPDGSQVTVHSKAEIAPGQLGGLPRFFGTMVDITERKRAEALHALELTAVEQSADGIVITDTVGKIQYVNPAFSSITGYAREEALGKNSRILRSGQQDRPFYQNLWDTIKAGRVWKGELVNRRKDGSLYTQYMTVAPVRDKQGVIMNFVAVQHDITERNRLEAQFFQAQKMESVGRLAGGVAHDFNNHLGIILGYSELLLERLGADDPLRKNARMIKEAALRSASLTRQLLAFSRRQVIEPRVLDLNAGISELEKMLRPLIGEDIELVTLLDPALGKVRADPAQIDQVIINLAVNSRDAMPQGGRLTIETANVELDEAYAKTHVTVQAGSYVMLAVSDNGMGIGMETLAHIFEPFFTTKEKGKGTGLGLAMVYGIVKQSGGCIWVYSEPGQGTIFKLYLPRLEEGIRVAEVEQVSPSSLKGEETVLVAEDEAMLRELACVFLRSSGYTVLEAGNGAEAIEIFKRHEGPIHLLMTDVVMPGMSGRELALWLHDSRPDTKVLYVSGYTDDVILRNGLLEAGTSFLQKPFTQDGLMHKVRAVLGESRLPLAAEPITDLTVPAVPQASVSGPVDVSVLAGLVGNNPEVVRNFQQAFRLSAAGIVAELRAACAAGQTRAAGAAAHKLKSSARAMGALALGELCVEMERAGNAGQMEALASLLPKFEAEMAAVDDYLGSL